MAEPAAPSGQPFDDKAAQELERALREAAGRGPARDHEIAADDAGGTALAEDPSGAPEKPPASGAG